MLLKNLKTRIEETLGLDVITMPSLLTCVNNCIASIHAKDYREFAEVEYNITDSLPFSIAEPANSNEVLYLKVRTTDGIFKADRVALTDPRLMSANVDGVYRTEINLHAVIFYVKLGMIYIDSVIDLEIDKVFIGYYKKIPALSMELTQASLEGDSTTTPVIPQAEIEVREELESAFVFYGLTFFASRYKFRPEVVDAYNKEYKYFVEDMLVQLDVDDRYLEETTIDVEDRF